MIGQSHFGGTVACRAWLPLSPRAATDSPVSFGAASGSPFPYPHARTLRRAWGWQSPLAEMHRPDLVRVAHHEAGHVVLLEWVGLDGATASATSTSGLCLMPALPADRPDPGEDATGELAATAASIYHAGAMAELIYLGVKRTGPLFYPAQVDYQRAEAMLLPRFGSHSSAGHGFAQRVALHVLASQWPRVQKIARCLVKTGKWPSKNTKKDPKNGNCPTSH